MFTTTLFDGLILPGLTTTLLESRAQRAGMRLQVFQSLALGTCQAQMSRLKGIEGEMAHGAAVARTGSQARDLFVPGVTVMENAIRAHLTRFGLPKGMHMAPMVANIFTVLSGIKTQGLVSVIQNGSVDRAPIT